MIRTIIAIALLSNQCYGGTCLAVKASDGKAGTCAVFLQHVKHPGLYVAITARHVIEGAPSIAVSLKSGWARATKVYWLDELDVAFIEFRTDEKLSAFSVGPDPAVGEEVQFKGFAYGNDWVEGKQVAIVESPGKGVAEYPPYKGQSGGAVLDSQGNLVGVIAATSPDQLHYVPMGKIQDVCCRRWGHFWGIGCQPLPPGNSPPPQGAPEGDVIPPAPVQPQPIQPQPEEPPPPPQVENPAQSQEVAKLKAVIAELIVEVSRLKQVETPIRVRRKSDGVVISEERVKLAQGQPINLDLDDKTMEELRKLLGK